MRAGGCLEVDSRSDQKVVIGVISGHFGVKGWVKVKSHTRPREQIFEYPEIFAGNLALKDSWKRFTVEETKCQGKGLVCKFKGLQSRGDAEPYIGCEISVTRDQLAPLPEGEFYWMDVIGCDVVNVQGIELGRLESIMETGANDVFVVKDDQYPGKELLIPWIESVVLDVDLGNSLITVDWQEEFLE